jgi:hypothetical protein
VLLALIRSTDGQLTGTSKEYVTLTVIFLHKLLTGEEPRVQRCDNGGEVCPEEVDRKCSRSHCCEMSVRSMDKLRFPCYDILLVPSLSFVPSVVPFVLLGKKISLCPRHQRGLRGHAVVVAGRMSSRRSPMMIYSYIDRSLLVSSTHL